MSRNLVGSIIALTAAVWLAGPVAEAESALGRATEVARVSAVLYAQGNLDGAAKLLQEAVTESPSDAQLRFLLANALFRQQNWSGASHHYAEVVRLQPTYPDAHLNLGFAWYQARRIDDAIAAWHIAVAQTPTDALPHLSLAVGLRANGRIGEARDHVVLALEQDAGWHERLSIDIRWTPDMVRAISDLVGTVAPAQGG